MELRTVLREQKNLLIVDLITLALVTVFGFLSHGTLGKAGMRLLSTFIPLVLAWLLIAPHFHLYDVAIIKDIRQLWRPLWAMILAATLAAWLRGVWLASPILPDFVLILGGLSAIGLLIWRGLFVMVDYRR